MIRLTLPAGRDLEAAEEIRRRMREEGIATPLIADVHFSPRLAVEACEFFEKVRINPGNYSDISKNSHRKDRIGLKEGRERLREAIKPLVGNLKKYGRALRIGVNHGSLSQRIIEQFGDSPGGMVESALEMAALFEEQGFDRLVVSLKSSNPIVVQKAYRLLAARRPEGGAMPFHLGVTEAGSGMMGRIKGLVGIGVLLRDGLGDTIRISLTEEGVNEVSYARELLKSLEGFSTDPDPNGEAWFRSLEHQRVANQTLLWNGCPIGGASSVKIGVPQKAEGFSVDRDLDPDFAYETKEDGTIPGDLSKPLLLPSHIAEPEGADLSRYSAILLKNDLPLEELRRHCKKREGSASPSPPVGVRLPLANSGESVLQREIDLAAALSEGLIDFLLVSRSIAPAQLKRLVCLLQATRCKVLLPDYIACPSCGRTLFDLQSTVGRIKAATSHLKGIKIGIMGCIVNGPGEMADADFGYVGSGSGKIDLYMGGKRVERGVEEHRAVDALIRLIKKADRWIEPNGRGASPTADTS